MCLFKSSVAKGNQFDLLLFKDVELAKLVSSLFRAHDYDILPGSKFALYLGSEVEIERPCGTTAMRAQTIHKAAPFGMSSFYLYRH